MSVTEFKIYTCDLCFSSKKEDKIIEIELDDSYQERDWIKKHVCHECFEKLMKNYKQK